MNKQTTTDNGAAAARTATNELFCRDEKPSADARLLAMAIMATGRLIADALYHVADETGEPKNVSCASAKWSFDQLDWVEMELRRFLEIEKEIEAEAD